MYDLDHYPKGKIKALLDFVNKELAKNDYYKLASNYAQVVFDSTKNHVDVKVFYKDDFPLDYFRVPLKYMR